MYLTKCCAFAFSDTLPSFSHRREFFIHFYGRYGIWNAFHVSNVSNQFKCENKIWDTCCRPTRYRKRGHLCWFTFSACNTCEGSRDSGICVRIDSMSYSWALKIVPMWWKFIRILRQCGNNGSNPEKAQPIASRQFFLFGFGNRISRHIENCKK